MEHELEKLVSRYQKAAERKQYWEPHWRECYEYAFPLRENVSSALYGSNKGERKTSASMTERRRMRLISWLPRCWRN